MKALFTLAITFFGLSLVAQKPCCTPTKQFAQLGAEESFKSEHQLPASRSIENAMGSFVDFATPDEKPGRAYIVRAKESTNKYLFVFHEWWGLNDNIVAEAEKWAKLLPGVTIMAIDLYDGKVATTREAASEFMQGASETRIKSIIEGALQMVGEDAQIATIGWCFGGGWSMQASLMLAEQAVGCVVYYGMPVRNSEELVGLNCKVLGIFAEQDKWINRKVIGEYEQAMNEADKAYETFWYDAAHAFANPSNSVFDEKAAADANQKALEFLRQSF